MQSIFWITGSFNRAGYVRWTFESVELWELKRFRPYTCMLLLMSCPTLPWCSSNPLLWKHDSSALWYEAATSDAYSVIDAWKQNIGRVVCAACWRNMEMSQTTPWSPTWSLKFGSLTFHEHIQRQRTRREIYEIIWNTLILQSWRMLSGLRRFQDNQLCRLLFWKVCSLWYFTKHGQIAAMVGLSWDGQVRAHLFVLLAWADWTLLVGALWHAWI